jgi:hypothetical protein
MTKPDWMLSDWETLETFPTYPIARQLGALCRYAGATPHHYSVARHSLLVVALLPNEPVMQLAGLVHDAHECWTGDVLRPASVRFKLPLVELQDAIDRHLWSLLGIDPDPIDLRYIAQADDTACKLEMQLLGKPKTAIELAMVGYAGAAVHLWFTSNASIDRQTWQLRLNDLTADEPEITDEQHEAAQAKARQDHAMGRAEYLREREKDGES